MKLKQKQPIPVRAMMFLFLLVSVYTICAAIDEGIGLLIVLIVAVILLFSAVRLENEIECDHPSAKYDTGIQTFGTLCLLCSMFTKGIESGWFKTFVVGFIVFSLISMMQLFNTLLEDGTDPKRASILSCSSFMKSFAFGTVLGLILALILMPIVNRKTKPGNNRKKKH